MSFKQEEFQLQLDESGQVTGEMNSTLTRYEALNFYAKFGDNPRGENRTTIEARSPQLFLTEGQITPKKGEVQLVYQLRKFNFARLDEHTKTMTFNPMEFYQDKENPFVSETRQSDIHFVYPFRDSYKVTIELPKGYQVKQLPSNSVVTAKVIGMNMTYEVKALDSNQVQIGYTLRVTNPVVAKKYYSELRSFYADVSKKMNELIVLEQVNELEKK